MPFKDGDAKVSDAYYVQDNPNLAESSDCLKKVLDAKYEQADLKEICCNQDQLSTAEQQKLLQLLNKCATLFDGTLGQWTGTQVNLELKPDHLEKGEDSRTSSVD